MTWVKICGMTNFEDALVAVDAGADAVGFVFYEKSPRCVNVETAREIVEKLPKSIEKVGVFAGDSIEHAVEMGRRAGFDALQLYLLTHRKFASKDTPFASARNERGDAESLCRTAGQLVPGRRIQECGGTFGGAAIRGAGRAVSGFWEFAETRRDGRAVRLARSGKCGEGVESTSEGCRCGWFNSSECWRGDRDPEALGSGCGFWS